MIVTQNIKANVSRANLFNPLVMAEDDESSRVLVAQIVHGDEVLALTSEMVSLNYKMADGNVGSVTGEVKNGKVSVPIPNEILTLDDYVLCDISIKNSKEMTFHTPTIINNQLTATSETLTETVILKTGSFLIDSRYRVMEVL